MALFSTANCDMIEKIVVPTLGSLLGGNNIGSNAFKMIKWLLAGQAFIQSFASVSDLNISINELVFIESFITPDLLSKNILNHYN
jgi:hypothetical protein